MLTSARGPNGGGNGRGGVEYVKLSNGTILTKHDAGINGRNNAREATDRCVVRERYGARFGTGSK